jgi:hypothetical protein
VDRMVNYDWNQLNYKEKQCLDIVKKGIIRAMRRFFSRIFLNQNKTIREKRIKNVYYKDALRSMKQLITKLFPDYSDVQELAEFMIPFCSLKLKANNGPLTEAGRRGEEVLEVSDAFSRPKYSKIHKYPEFAFLVNFVYEGTLSLSGESCFELIQKNEEKLFRKNTPLVMGEFEKLNERCLETLNK